MITPFIPNKDPREPLYYSITIEWLDGATKTYEVASHLYEWTTPAYAPNLTALPMSVGMLILTLKEDLFIHVPVSGIKSIAFDKNWSKIVALREEEMKNATSS